MAIEKTSGARAWFFPTSPRSPYKLQGELQLLKQLDGKVWNTETQIEFSKLLMTHEEFAGKEAFKNPAFSARDRANRTPRLLGFVHFKKEGKNPILQFTDVGNFFLKAAPEEQNLIFQRQIAKVQFKSPLHKNKGFETMSIRPLMVMIKMLLELGDMSKEEIALFGITLIDKNDIEDRIKEVKKYRAEIAKLKTNDKKAYRRDFSVKWVNHIYASEIKAGKVKLREGGSNFSAKKYRTLRDYADSTIRYLKATGLFTITPHGQRLLLTNANLTILNFC